MKTFTGISASIILLAGGCLALPADAQTPKKPTTVDEVAMYQGGDRDDLLIAAAKKEGEVSIYQAYPALNSVEAAFTKKYGIKVKNWRAGSEAILQRVITESRGSRFDVDIVQNNAPEQEALHREKLLQEVYSPHLKDLVPGASPAHKEWVGITLDVWTAAYNSDKIKKEDLPKTYQDLLNPKYKNKLGVEANDYGWFGYLLSELGEPQSKKLFSDIVKTNGMSFRKGHSLLATMVSSGEVPIGLSLYSWTVPPMKKKGAPVEPLLLQPILAQFSTMAMVKKAPHPNAAMLFYDFMLNEGQQILADQDFVVTTKKIVTPFTNVPLKILDPGRALDTQDKWTQEYENILIKNDKQ
ncbi:MAG: fbpA 3 [Herbaspirillum sp.]|jgi:iron(III) transport system substrate-binding protein|nr:fbpA 3 [Herbaspirillum sp.]